VTGVRTGRPRTTTDPHERLLARTRRRLAILVLVLVGTLVVTIGAATALTAVRVLDDEANRSLQASSSAFLGRLDGSITGPAAGVATPAATSSPGSSSDEGTDNENVERPPAESDTFHLVLDPSGMLVSNPARVPLATLPNQAAVEAARASGSDLRTVTESGTRVRLLTVPVTNDGAIVGFVQSGFVLTLQDRQVQTVVLTVVVVGLLGLLGAAVVTVLVVGRALVPIRSAFDTERRFVADASHEIRTPAAIIRASAEVLEREGLVTDDGRPLVADMVAEADRLGRLVDDLLELDASDRGSLALDRHPIDLAALAAETAARARPLATERGVELASPGSVVPIVVDGDPDRLIQVVVVLLDNATRHTPGGTTVTASVVRSGGMGILRVDDQGPGIPPAARETIFEPFARLPGASATNASGSGLGLAIARRIAELHAGTLTATDAPGGGARFELAIPLAKGFGGRDLAG
jgi:signal transduction histidine kinase